MKLPNLPRSPGKIRREEVAFGGVNTSEKHTAGEWEETENLGSGRWPALSPRLGRAVSRECAAPPTALYAWEELASVEGTGFYYGGQYIGEVSAGPKQMVRVGDWIVIWPDKKYYHWKTGEFTALEVGFPLTLGMSAVIGGDYVALPERQLAWLPTSAAPVTHTGSYLGVTASARQGRTYEYGSLLRQSYFDDDGYFVSYDTITSTKQLSIEYGTVGQMVRLDQRDADGASYWGRVTAVLTEEREYMPGVLRKYTTVQYEKWRARSEGRGYERMETYSGGSFRPVTGVLSDWTYGTTQTVLRAGLEPGFGWSFFRKKADNAERAGYSYQFSPSLAGTPLHLADEDVDSTLRIEVGDLLRYDETTGLAQMLTAIDRGYYTDHYYTASYTLQEVSLQELGANTDPAVTAAALAIGVGDPVRVSRGSVSISTRIRDFDAAYTKADSIEVPGMAPAPYGIRFTDDISALRGERGELSIDRITDPELSYICVHNHRLWGVHEGRIWCSAPGDPQNFELPPDGAEEAGLDPDLYAWMTEVGSPGDWTGIVSYSGAVLAFQENLVYKVVGDRPGSFTVSTYHIAGIQPGSHQSAAIVNEVLYYKGSGGVYAYSGYTPSLISENFGQRQFRDAVGGTDGTRYYLSMRDDAGDWQLYCYDTVRGVWLREDGLHAAAFSLYDGRLYCAAEEAGTILSFGGPVEAGIPWQAVSTPFYEDSFRRKRLTKLLIRAELPAGSTIRVAISYDGGDWQELYNTRAPRWRVAILPVRPKRCDSFRLRLMGEGDVTIRGIAREYLLGSEV
ncbi:MAG: hypothetical protein E7458_03895 [Ruminococcaceae bacterium]|nr:hypothetical protein [Oscillospiraceae bacterium]